MTANYARRVASSGYKDPPVLIVIDPRVVQPKLADLMSDEDVAAWQANPHCLCGCGQATLRERTLRARCPYGAYRLFRGGHETRMPWFTALMAGVNTDPERRRKISMVSRSHTVDAGILADDIIEWRAITQLRLGDLADRSRISLRHIQDITSGRAPRVKQVTAGKLLVAMNQPLRPEIAAAYRRWAKANRVSTKDMIVEKTRNRSLTNP